MDFSWLSDMRLANYLKLQQTFHLLLKLFEILLEKVLEKCLAHFTSNPKND
jgi:hypothetical protein